MKNKIKIIKYFTLLYFISLIRKTLSVFPIFKKIYATKSTQTPITFSLWFYQKVLGINRNAYWQMHRTSLVHGANNVILGIETSPGLMPNCYIDACYNNIFIGDYTQVGPNVGLLGSNHALTDNRLNVTKGPIKIGKYCWLGMGSRILSGVHLGDYTIVGANSVVTKPFPEGYCVIGGNPAKLIKHITKEECVFHESKNKFVGYIQAENFENYKGKYLNICAE